MHILHGTNKRASSSDKHNQVYNNSDRNYKSMDTQQDKVGVNNANMPQIGHNDGPNVIRTRSG